MTDSSLKHYLGVHSIRNPHWIDADSFVYSSNQSGAPQVWRMQIADRSKQQISHYEDFITSIVTDSQTGRYAFMMGSGGNERSQIFFAQGDEIPQNLTNQPEAVHMLGAFIPGTNLLLFSSNLRNPLHFDLETIDVVTGKRTLVLENNDHYNFIDSVSPDGRYYMYRKLIKESNQPLWMYDTVLKETTQIQVSESLSKNEGTLWINDRQFYFLTNDHSEFMRLVQYDLDSQEVTPILNFNWDIESIAFNHDKSLMSLILNEDGYLNLYVYDTTNWQPLNTPRPPKGATTYYDSVSWSPVGNKLIFSFSSGSHVPNIWLIDLDQDCCQRLTDNKLQGEHQPLVEPILKRYQSFDGLSVPYFLYVPYGKKPENLPVLIEIHGGPEGQSSASFDEVLAYFISEGIAVVVPNVRGSTGYGQTYTHLDDVEKRLDSVKDIEALVHHLVNENIADKDKIAVSGTSYGGFMTLSCAARYPELFCAAVDTVGMYNLVTFLERTAGFRRAHRESEYGTLEFDREVLYNVSPVAKVDNISGPIMIIHGTNDPRVPVFEAQQVVSYLDEKGVEVHFLEYQDEGHGIHKMANRMDCYPKVVSFLKEKMQIL